MAKSRNLPAKPNRREIGINLPGKLTPTSWTLPQNLSREDWIKCGKALREIESGHQWWTGDWWAFSEDRKWGEGEQIAEAAGVAYQYARDCGSVSRAFKLSSRDDNLTFSHHRYAMAVEGAKARQTWLRRALKGTDGKSWSAQQLRAEIARAAAIGRTGAADILSAKTGKFAVLYADPPWRYENPPMGGTNRSIENQYPTMMLDQICALPIREIAHDDSVLYLWTTSPKLAESFKVLEAWGFSEPRTTAVWVKDQIGMGYYFREMHELLLVAKRGELPPPDEANRVPSVFEAPRLEHSAKPPLFYDVLDLMYPKIRKIELFNRGKLDRPYWSTWGNQAVKQEAA